MKRRIGLLLALLALAVIGFQASATAQPEPEPAPTGISLDSAFLAATPDSGDPFGNEESAGGRNCQKQCERAEKRCVRAGNDPTYCYDNVFCACMCDTCGDCIC